MKNTLINIGLAVCSIAIFVLGIEVMLRVTGLQTVRPNPPQIYQKSENPEISYELKPNIKEKAYRNIVTTNSLGFRSPELNDKPIIAMLGDSIAFGYGVKDSETLARVVDASFPEYQILNTGVPGYHLGMETAAYQEKVAALQPVMLMLVYHYNDLDYQTGWLDDIGVIRSPDWQPTDEICSPIDTGMLSLLPGKCWLDMNSAFYKATKKVINMRYMKQQLEVTREESKQKPEEEDATDEQLAEYARQLDQLVAILPSDMPKMFIIWPDRRLRTASRPKLRTIVEQRGFVVVDLYDTFGNEAETLGWDTVHPNPTTIQTAAKVLAEKFTAM